MGVSRSSPPPPKSRPAVPSFLAPPTWLAAGIIVLAGAAAYQNCYSGALVFDDPASIVDNLTIRHLWPLGTVLAPPHGGVTVEGRPVLNLSLALNYALSGTRVGSYHACNVAIHLLAGLTLFGVVRRLAQRRGEAAAGFLALAVALFWTVHPLQTESVTYIIQRAESLMGLFYLLTLYGFLRGVEPGGRPVWLGLSVLACLLGMATKEVMVSAPVTVLLCDYVFVAGSFRAAWQRRRAYYLALAATWLLLGYLVFSTHNRGGTSGFTVGLPWWIYWVTQSPAIVHYLWLSVWPHPLVFDYGFIRYWIHHPLVSIPAVLGVAALLAAAWVGLRRRAAWGFLAYGFLAILAPTSVIPGTRQSMAEHRMYLALAPVLVALVWAGWRLGRGSAAVSRGGSLRPWAAWGGVLVLAGALGAATFRRNEDYRTGLALWTSAAATTPDNPYTLNTLGTMLFEAGRMEEAQAQFAASLQLYPEYAEAEANLGCVLAKEGKVAQGLADLADAARLKPESPKIRSIWGDVLGQAGQTSQALEQFSLAVKLDPGFAEAHYQWGNVALALGHAEEAKTQYEEAARLHPDMPEVHNNLGNALAQLGLFPQAVAEAQWALRLRPDYPEAVNNLAITYAQMGRIPEAVAAFARAAQQDPTSPEIHNNYANVLRKVGRTTEARAQYEEALRLRPDYPDARSNLDRLLAAP